MTGSPADRAVELYAERGWLRAGVQLVPYVGGAIDALITTRAEHLARARIESLLDEMKRTAERLAEDKIDREFVGSEEWDDLVLRAFRAAADSGDREKHRLVAAILMGAATRDALGEMDPQAILGAVAELSPLELALARAVYDLNEAPRLPDEAALNELQLVELRGWNEPASWAPAAALANLNFHLKRVERTGLIEELTGSYLGYGGGVYIPTRTFKALVAFLAGQA